MKHFYISASVYQMLVHIYEELEFDCRIVGCYTEGFAMGRADYRIDPEVIDDRLRSRLYWLRVSVHPWEEVLLRVMLAEPKYSRFDLRVVVLDKKEEEVLI